MGEQVGKGELVGVAEVDGGGDRAGQAEERVD